MKSDKPPSKLKVNITLLLLLLLILFWIVKSIFYRQVVY